MPGNTPRYGWPYPTGVDRVVDGDNAIQALAVAVENTLVPLDMSPFGAMYTPSVGPGVGGTMWFNATAIAFGGGCAAGAGPFPATGVKVSRKGIYALHFAANVYHDSAGAVGMGARVFIGDGAAAYCSGQAAIPTAGQNVAVSCMTVRQMAANESAFIGMTSIGPQAAAVRGNADANTFLVRMLAPLP